MVDNVTERTLSAIISDAAEEFQSEILLYSGPIERGFEGQIMDWCQQPKKYPNTLLMLATYGGSADAAYRITRALQNRCGDNEKFYLFAFHHCKSAGTLVAIGADEIIMSDMAELGPLDVQIRKQDELFESASGLTPVQALATLRDESFQLFEKHFLDLRIKSGYQISTRLAAKIATSLTGELFRPLYEQVDPIRLGETYRSMEIALHYGERLKKETRNLKQDTLEKLITAYPSHSFVIDRTEACTLFEKVLEPSKILTELVERIGNYSLKWLFETEPFILSLIDEIDEACNKNHTKEEHHEPLDGESVESEEGERKENGRNTEEGGQSPN